MKLKLVLQISVVAILLKSGGAQECYEFGLCTGGVIGATTENSINDCLDVCKSTTGCSWFSYDTSNGFCGAFINCPSLDTDNEQCVSGESNCEYIQCDVPGQCVGAFVNEDSAQTQLECQTACAEYNAANEEHECHYNTFNEDEGLCLMFSDCAAFSEELCQSCVSNHAACLLENTTTTTDAPTSTPATTTSAGPTTPSPEKEFLFVVGGFDQNEAEGAEVTTLNPSDNPLPDCVQDLSSAPIKFTGSKGAALIDADGYPIVCGSYHSPNDECWKYTPTFDEWVKLSTMPEGLAGYAGAGGHAYSDAWGLVMAGMGGSHTSVFYTKDGVNFIGISPLPEEGMFGSLCLVTLDDNTLMAMGLGTNNNKVYVYHGREGYWEEFPDLAHGRFGMSCGVANDGNGTVVVAAGGNDGDSRLDVVEIFSWQREDQWRTGNPLPEVLYFAATTPIEDSFLLTGGYGEDERDTIYKYDGTSDSWILMDTRLTTPRYYHVAMMVQSSTFDVCD